MLHKWQGEQGPSRALKDAVAGGDIAALERAIAVAKEAGIGIKAAKKRLAALEQTAAAQQALDAAMLGAGFFVCVFFCISGMGGGLPFGAGLLARWLLCWPSG